MAAPDVYMREAQLLVERFILNGYHGNESRKCTKRDFLILTVFSGLSVALFS